MFPRYFSGEITNWPRLPCYSLDKSCICVWVQHNCHQFDRNEGPHSSCDAPKPADLPHVPLHLPQAIEFTRVTKDASCGRQIRELTEISQGLQEACSESPVP